MITRVVVTTIGMKDKFNIGEVYTIQGKKVALVEIIAFEKSFCLIFKGNKKITYQNVSFYFITE